MIRDAYVGKDNFFINIKILKFAKWYWKNIEKTNLNLRNFLPT